MSAADTSERLLSIAEFAALDSGDEPMELVRGKVVKYRYLYPIQGVVTVNVSCAILKRVEDLGLGEMTLGGVGVITGRNPDTVRAAKVATAIDDLNLGKLLPESMPGCVVPVSEFFDD